MSMCKRVLKDLFRPSVSVIASGDTCNQSDGHFEESSLAMLLLLPLGVYETSKSQCIPSKVSTLMLMLGGNVPSLSVKCHRSNFLQNTFYVM